MITTLIAAAVLAGAAPADGPVDWLSTGPFGGAAAIVRVPPKQPNLVVGATSNGLIYTSSDGGASWSNQFFPAQLAGTLHALEIDPRNPSVWYAGVQSDNAAVGGVLKTEDGGATWKPLSGLKGKAVWALALWPGQPDVIAAGTGEGVFLSRNAGASWARISPESNRELQPVVSLAFHPTDSKILYAGTTHLPWRTRDGGKTWQSIHSGMLDDSDVFSIAIETDSPASVYASACSGAYRSADGGSTWKRLPTPRGAFRTYLVSADPKRPGVVFAGTSAGLLRSANRGATWQRVSQHAVKSIAYDPVNPEKIYFASVTGGMLVSRDAGTTVVESNKGFSNRNFAGAAGSGDVLYASSVYEPGSGGIFRSGDGGATWQRMASPGTGENILLLAAAPDDADCVWAAGYRSVYHSADGAKTWEKEPAPAGVQSITALAALSRRTLLVGTASGLFSRTGTTWKAIELPGGRRPVELLQSSGNGALAAVAAGRAYRTENGGTSWAACGQPVANAVWYGLALDPGTGIALAATSQGLFRSTDRCASWSPARDGLNAGTVNAVVSHPKRAGEALAAQFGTIFYTTDGAASWRPLGSRGRNGAYPSALFVLPGAPQRLFALFPRRGILSISIEPQHSISTGEH